MNWFDLLLLAIAAIYLISGLIQGALKQLFGLLSFFIVLVLALLGSPYLSGFVTARLRPEYFSSAGEALQQYGLSLPVEEMARLAGTALTFLLLLIALSIIFRLLLRSLTAVNKIPVIGLFNRLGGALLGLLTALLINFLLVNVAVILPVAAVNEAVSGSLIADWMRLSLPPLVTGVKVNLIDCFLRNRIGGGV